MPDDSRPFQSPEGWEGFVAVSLPQGFQPGGTAGTLQGLQNFRPMTDARRSGFGRFWVQFRLEPPDFLEAVPQPGGQDGPDRLGHGAEVPLAHPEGQGQPGAVQYGFPVQYRGNSFQPPGPRPFPPREDDPL